MIPQRRILFIDDSTRDTELALNALKACHFANEVVALRDGVEALATSISAGPSPIGPMRRRRSFFST
jgi:hypothetical protein